MKLYWFDIPNCSYERTFDSEEYEKDPDNDRFCYTGPFVYWEAHKQALARIAELEKALRDIRAFLVQVNKGIEMGGIDSQIVADIDLALMGSVTQ